MQFRIPTLEDVQVLSELETTLNQDGEPTPGMRAMLQWCAEEHNSCRHGSLARTVVSEGQIKGFLSATLVANRTAEMLEEVVSPLTILDPPYYRPLEDEDVKRANRAFGAALYITSCFWRKSADANLDIDFVETAFDHIVRWFEGNTIHSVMIVVEDGLWEFADVVKRSLDPVCFVQKSTGGASTFVAVKSPLVRVGPSVDWLTRLLSNPEPPRKGLPDKLKLTGRILHEFDFDMREAILSGCLPWSWTDPPSGEKWSIQKSAPAHAEWRKEVKEQLGSKVTDRTTEPNSLLKIKAVLKEEPSLMAL